MTGVDEIPIWLVATVVVVALAVGASMILVVLAKYSISRWFHVLGGPTLTIVGAALIGLSVYGNVKLKVGEFEAELKHLQAALTESEAEAMALKSEMQDLRIQITQLSKEYSAAKHLLAKKENVIKDGKTWVTFTNIGRRTDSIKDKMMLFDASREMQRPIEESWEHDAAEDAAETASEE